MISNPLMMTTEELNSLGLSTYRIRKLGPDRIEYKHCGLGPYEIHYWKPRRFGKEIGKNARIAAKKWALRDACRAFEPGGIYARNDGRLIIVSSVNQEKIRGTYVSTGRSVSIESGRFVKLFCRREDRVALSGTEIQKLFGIAKAHATEDLIKDVIE